MKLSDLLGSILESEAKTPRRLRIRLMREGRSANRRDWGPVLEKVAELSKGVPLQALEFKSERFTQFFDHLKQRMRFLPSAVLEALPDLFPSSILGPIVETRIEGVAPNREVFGFVDLEEPQGWFGRLAGRLAAAGRELGVSIVVPGGGLTAVADGIGETVTGLSAISHYDVVTEPSAGGSIQAVLESIATGGSEMNFWELLKKYLSAERFAALEKTVPDAERAGFTAAVLAEKSPDALKEYVAAGEKAGIIPKLDPKAAAADDPKAVDPAKVVTAPAVTDPKATPAAVVVAPVVTSTPVAVPGIDPKVLARIDAVEKTQQAGVLESRLSASNLPEPYRALIRQQFAGGFADVAHVDGAITAFRTAVAKAHETDPAPLSIMESRTSGDQVRDALEAMFDRVREHPKSKVPAFYSIRRAYMESTGDVFMEGAGFYAKLAGRKRGSVLESYDWKGNRYFDLLASRVGHERAVMESVTTAGFPLILADVMHKRMAKAYVGSMEIALLRRLATFESCSDFKNWRIQRMGFYGALPVVGEGAAYLSLATPTEEEVSLQIEKHGGTEDITWEAILNDDTRKFLGIPAALSQAAIWTLWESFWNMYEDNETIYDSVALFHASHGNLGSAALSLTSLTARIDAMVVQKDRDSVRPVGAKPKFLFVPKELVWLGKQLVGSPSTNESQVNSGVISQVKDLNLELIPLYHFTDTNDWGLIADPGSIEGAAVAYLNGQENPELFVQDLQNVGSFFDQEKQILKVRHVWDRAVTDFRAAQKNVV